MPYIIVLHVYFFMFCLCTCLGSLTINLYENTALDSLCESSYSIIIQSVFRCRHDAYQHVVVGLVDILY